MNREYKIREVASMDVVARVERIRKISVMLSLIPIIGVVCLKGAVWKIVAVSFVFVLLAGSIFLMQREIQLATVKEVLLRFCGNDLILDIKKKEDASRRIHETVTLNRENFYNLQIQTEGKIVRITYRKDGEELHEDFSVRGLRNQEQCLKDLKEFAERTLTEQGYRRKER